METLLRYFHTVRHLRPKQLWFQVWRRLSRPRIDLSLPPALSTAPAEAEWSRSARREPSLLGPATFTFLGTTGNLDDLGWSDSRATLLWRYNQHYFDDLSARGATTRSEWHRALILRWLAENPPASRPAWDPYPSSLRLVNWCKWILRGADPVPGQAASMAVQARFLFRNLEFHVLGNHLLSNAKALVFVGALFEGAEPDRWLARGLRILADELPQQVLRDGGNYERSPMYHALCLEDLLDLVNLAAVRPSRIGKLHADRWRELVAGMRFWLAAMCHPDGEIAHFNDAAIGVAPSPEELHRYADDLSIPAVPAPGVERIGDGLVWLRDSGYVRAESDSAVLFCDVAPLGPDYLPAHGHADTLSFELSVHGKRVVVNGGTSRYGTGPERLAERGTQAHSTVTVSHCNSSEVWGGFRVARRACPFDISVRLTKGEAMIAASHDGYKRLHGAPVHRRTWRMSGRSLEIADQVAPARPAVARFIVHPDIDLERTGSELFQMGSVTLAVDVGEGERADAFHSARFGARRATAAVSVALDAGRSRATLTW